MKSVAVLLTVHNRKDITLNCLEGIYCNIQKCQENYLFDVYVTDDGSIDGTSDAILEKYSKIYIIRGNGNLFWCRGMIASWKYAVSKKEYDYFLWVNDDIVLFDNAFTLMFDTFYQCSDDSIIGGAFKSAVSGNMTYGGKTKNGIELIPNGEIQSFDLLHGNLVLLPAFVFNKVGMLDGTFHHGIGDYDYGLRALKKGIKLYLTPEYVGTCEGHSAFSKCYDVKYRLLQRFKYLYSPLGPNPNEVFVYMTRHYSIFRAMVVYLLTLLFVLFPFLKPCSVKEK